jgi:CRP-like cAMP-binding protein
MRFGDTLKSAYFCNTGLISTWTVFPDGKTVGTGIIGSDGYVGTPLPAGLRSASTRAVVQMDGSAWRVSAETLAAFLRDCPELRRQLECSAQIMAMEATQIGVCNALHNVEQRLTRCLLMCADRSGNAALPLTQEVLAKMLGIRRASITIAAGILQKAGIIAYARGNVSILKRPKLEARSCACYGTMQRQKQRWRGETGQLLKNRHLFI